MGVSSACSVMETTRTPRLRRDELCYLVVNFGIERIKAVKFGSGILGVEPPVDDGLGGVAFPYQGLDFFPESLLVRDPLPQAGAGQHAELDFRHPFDKLQIKIQEG